MEEPRQQIIQLQMYWIGDNIKKATTC